MKKRCSITPSASLAILLCGSLLGSQPLAAQKLAEPWVAARKAPFPKGIEEVKKGRRTVASAAWWGFHAGDATDAVQQAVDSGAETVVIPYMGQSWIVRPIQLRSDLELVLEPGVLLLAKQGEYRGRGDSMFTMQSESNVTIRGYGATLRMRKSDYQNPPYERAEWRMGIRMYGCRHILIEGLRVESSGGDGIYVDGGRERPSEDIVVRDCICHDNHRQGMSVICARDLLVEHCVFSHTRGTPPEAGIDFEPDSEEQYLVDCVVRNCTFAHNAGHAILVYLKPLTRHSEPVSIRFENCVSRMGSPGDTPRDLADPDTMGWSGMAVGAVKDDGPQGLIEFVNCTAENSGREGAKVFDKSALSAKVRFVNCNWSNAWVSRTRDYGGPRVSVLLELRRPELTRHLGGVDFVDCHVHDTLWRNTVVYSQNQSYLDLEDVTGTIWVHSPHAPRVRLGKTPRGVSLQVTGVQHGPEREVP